MDSLAKQVKSFAVATGACSCTLVVMPGQSLWAIGSSQSLPPVAKNELEASTNVLSMRPFLSHIGERKQLHAAWTISWPE